MNDDMKQLLDNLAARYNRKDFIEDDPVRFPHRYKSKTDVEISAFVSAWIAYGQRAQIIKTLERLHAEYEGSPTEFIRKGKFMRYKDDKSSLYRFFKGEDYYSLCQRFHTILFEENYPDLESRIVAAELDSKKLKSNSTAMESSFTAALNVLEKIIGLFPNQKGIPKDTSSACKRLCLFLRWMTRNDGVVDLGFWHLLRPQELIIPLDTHVYRLSRELNLCERNQADMKAAMEISLRLREYFPDDPIAGDFALFGYGVSRQSL